MASKKKDFYIIRKGRKTGRFSSWDEVKELVAGYPGAEYKGFTLSQMEEALEYENGENSEIIFIDYNPSEGEILAFTDGACEREGLGGPLKENLGYGALITRFTDGGLEKIAALAGQVELSNDSDSDLYKEIIKSANITGEAHSAILAMEYARMHGIKALTLVYDYEGVGKTCMGQWHPESVVLSKLQSYFDEMSKISDMKVTFIRTPSHLIEGVNELGMNVDDKFYKAFGDVDKGTLDEQKIDAMLERFYLLIGNYNADALANLGMTEGYMESREQTENFTVGSFSPDDFVIDGFNMLSEEEALAATDPKSLAYRLYKGAGKIT